MDEKRTKKVEQVKAALLKGAKYMYLHPKTISDKAGTKLTRLPLTSWVFGGGQGQFPLKAIVDRFQATATDVAYAIAEIHKEHSACIDTIGIEPHEIKAVQDVLQEVLDRRGSGGNKSAPLETDAKIYIRDNKADKPSTKGKSGVVVVQPVWLDEPVAVS